MPMHQRRLLLFLVAVALADRSSNDKRRTSAKYAKLQRDVAHAAHMAHLKTHQASGADADNAQGLMALRELEFKAIHMAAMKALSISTDKSETFVLIRGAAGVNSEAVNGDYLEVERTYNGKRLFAKEGDDDRWLRFVGTGNLNQWRVSSTQSLVSNDDKGYIYGVEHDQDNPAGVKDWFVWAGADWEHQRSVTVTSQGPRAQLGIHADDGGGWRLTGAFLRCLRWFTFVVVVVFMPVTCIALLAQQRAEGSRVPKDLWPTPLVPILGLVSRIFARASAATASAASRKPGDGAHRSAKPQAQAEPQPKPKFKPELQARPKPVPEPQ